MRDASLVRSKITVARFTGINYRICIEQKAETTFAGD
jgi:hypothetical protein